MEPPKEKGLACPNCGSHDLKIPNSYDVMNARRRRRQCKKCGRVFRTSEKISE